MTSVGRTRRWRWRRKWRGRCSSGCGNLSSGDNISEGDEHVQRVMRKLDPDAIFRNLTRAGLFLMCWEQLRVEIVQKVRGFFVHGWSHDEGEIVHEDYKRQVLSRSKHPFEASCSWLVEMGALTQVEADCALHICDHRNKIAHETMRLVCDPKFEINLALLDELIGVLRSLTRFWAQIEIDTDPDIDQSLVDSEGITSPPLLIVEHVKGIIDTVDRIMRDTRSGGT